MGGEFLSCAEALFIFLVAVIIFSVDDAKCKKAAANRDKDVVFPDQSSDKKTNCACKIKEHNHFTFVFHIFNSPFKVRFVCPLNWQLSAINYLFITEILHQD